MPSEAGYYRFPTIHDDTVVFVCEDDLWTAPVGGGPARRMSANPGASSRPVLSPDGKLLAFTGRDEGQEEVWVMPAEGGRPTRLTFLGGFAYVAGWRPDGSGIVFASDAGQPFMAYYHLHEVAPDGGPHRPLNFGPAMSISSEPDGPGVVIGRNTGDPARWMRYRGGTAGTLWVDRKGDGRFKKLVNLPGNLAGPMWIGSRIYFLSDHEGVGNLYSCPPSGRNVRRETHHEDYYARFPQTDGRRIVYASGADLWVFDPASGETRRIDIEVSSARPQRNRKFVDAARFLESFSVHPEGHSLCVTTRGRPFTFALWEDAVVQQGKAGALRYRLAQWLPDKKRLVAVTDEGGEEELVLVSAGGSTSRVKLDLDLGRIVDLAVAPGKSGRVALTNHRYEVIVADLAKKSAKVVDKSGYVRVEGIAWSPDGRWLAYGLNESFSVSTLKLYDARRARVHRITRPDFKDGSPAFDPEGKYLYFVSYREYDPVYEHHQFELSFPRGGRIMALPLQRDLPSPFEPKPRPPMPPGMGPGGPGEMGPKGAKPKGKAKDEKKAAPDVKIDLVGIEDRAVAMPVPEGLYGQVAAVPGKVIYTSYPIEGSLGVDWTAVEPEAKGAIEAWDLVEQKHETLVSGITYFELSADAHTLVYRAGNRLRALPAGIKPEPAAAEKPPGRESGWIDLSRVKVSVEPATEWAQMYREAWRLMRDQFWVPDMSGVDWEKVYERYLPLLDRVATRSEFSDLMWEMQGELGTSHAYEIGGDYRPPPFYMQGHLGADLAFDSAEKVWRVARIPRGDSWNPAAASPLAAPGNNLSVGDRILAVGQRKLGRGCSPAEALVNLAGEKVELTVADEAGKKRRKVTTRTLTSELDLPYRDWVEANREAVHEATGGRVGYVHIPNMGPRGYSEFHRYFLAELGKEGLIVDVRFNGGGHVSQLILEKLLRRRVGFDTQRHGEAMPYPSEAAAGPMVALTNERAGSDGDIFSHCFKLYGLGPLIGKRTWGGVVGIWPRHLLVDGTITTQPEFSFWFEDVGFGVENYGTDPDIEVEIRPQDHAARKDPQLERGLREIEKIMKKSPPLAADLTKRPKLGLPRLPDRPL